MTRLVHTDERCSGHPMGTIPGMEEMVVMGPCPGYSEQDEQIESRYSSEITFKVVHPMRSYELRAAISMVLREMQAEGAIIKVGSEIRVACLLPAGIVKQLPWQSDMQNPSLEIVAVEAEPLNGPRH